MRRPNRFPAAIAAPGPRKEPAMVNRLPRIVLLLTLSTTVLASSAGSASSSVDPLSKVSPSVLRATAGGGATTFLAILTSRADLSGPPPPTGNPPKDRFVFDT